MSETLATPTKPAPPRNGPSDLRMLARVEKWMAMIREINEINREQQSKAQFRG
jgi:hypothetical protein